MPTAPGALPLLGHLPPLLQDPLSFLTSLPDYGNLVQIRLGPRAAVVVCDPKLTRQILVDDHTFDKGGPLIDRAREVLGNGLASCPHQEHRRQRRLVQPAFHPARLPEYARTMTTRATAVIQSWQDGQVLDVLAEMMTITSATVTESLSNGFTAPQMRQAAADSNTFIAGLYRRMLLAPLNWLPTPGNRRYQQARTRLWRTIDTMIVQARANSADHGDLLSALLAARDPVGAATPDRQGLSDSEIRDIALGLLITGTEGPAVALAWALHLISDHHALEQRLHAEVDTVLTDGTARVEHLPKLELTGHIITEALRLYPPAWMLTRTVATDTDLGGHRLLAGTTVIYSPYLIHRRSDVYEHPDRFDPDRWNTSQHRPPPRHAFIPFGAGTRKCPGDTYAIAETTLTLATIAAHWRLHPFPGQHVRPAPSALLKPHGLRMRATPRLAARPHKGRAYQPPRPPQAAALPAAPQEHVSRTDTSP
ncbi:cytochrome P450 [Streptomyces sp. NRRL B-1347]|uniref:cytochrome P450 n=1 Tax=Streptomyces sp. NRRL B-1347 TaxID=1476877 RepID=UPI000B0AA275|nr:cytochrome P450 [Streptomyces sp. NRRL B-1347]